MKRDYNHNSERLNSDAFGVRNVVGGAMEVHKSGTGAPRKGLQRMLAGLVLAIALLISTPGVAEPNEVDGLMVLVRSDTVAISFEADQGVVAGSVLETAGSANYYQVILFVQDTAPGANLLVKGSGSGVSGASQCEDFGILVKGSGSGTASHGPCSFDHPNAWGFAEVEVGVNQALITIHRVEDGQAIEYASVIVD